MHFGLQISSLVAGCSFLSFSFGVVGHLCRGLERSAARPVPQETAQFSHEAHSGAKIQARARNKGHGFSRGTHTGSEIQVRAADAAPTFDRLAVESGLNISVDA